VPGPLIAKLSSKWLALIDAAGHRANYIHSLHQRYGPVVRIAPHELSFASAAAARDIYVGVSVAVGTAHSVAAPSSGSSSKPTTALTSSDSITTGTATTVTKTFPKSSWYDAIGRRSVFRMRDEAEHHARLKRVGHCYSLGVLRDTEGIIRSDTARLLAYFERQRGKAQDVLRPFRMCAMDIAGE
jgi:hypothetical protein